MIKLVVPIHIKVSTELVADIKVLLNLSPEMPANFAVDAALRELKLRLEKEKQRGNGGKEATQ